MIQKPINFFVFLLMFFLAFSSSVFSNDWMQTGKIVRPEPTSSGEFGYQSVSVSMDRIIVGDYGAVRTNDNLKVGIAYIFKKENGNWVKEVSLQPTELKANDFFGISVAISGDIAAIGAWGDDHSGSASGSVYIYRLVGGAWFFQQKIVANDAAEDDNFGFAVAADNGVVVVSALRDAQGGANAGAAYVFSEVNGTWNQDQKLIASDAKSGAYFGRSIAIDNNKIAVGANINNYLLSNEQGGAAYVFELETGIWTEKQKLVAPGGRFPGEFFASKLDISGEVLVVGSSFDNVNGFTSGSAFVFEKINDVWVEKQKLLPSLGVASDYFGSSVAISGTTIVIGSVVPSDGSGLATSNLGRVYVFTLENSTWVETQKFQGTESPSVHRFGQAVAIDGKTTIAASYHKSGLDFGAVYVYSTETLVDTKLIQLVGVQVYPNPASSFVKITSKVGLSFIKISNALGQELKIYALNNLKNFELDFSDLQTGIYFLELLTNDSRKLVKIIKN